MINIVNFEDFEKKIMWKLLEGEDNVLEILRKQFEKAVVLNRSFSGTGFFTKFNIPQDVIKLIPPKSFQFGDVIGQIDGVNDGVGFILFVKNGIIDFLEGYTYGSENFPETILNYQLSYASGEKRDYEQIRVKWM